MLATLKKYCQRLFAPSKAAKNAHRVLRDALNRLPENAALKTDGIVEVIRPWHRPEGIPEESEQRTGALAANHRPGNEYPRTFFDVNVGRDKDGLFRAMVCISPTNLMYTLNILIRDRKVERIIANGTALEGRDIEPDTANLAFLTLYRLEAILDRYERAPSVDTKELL